MEKFIQIRDKLLYNNKILSAFYSVILALFPVLCLYKAFYKFTIGDVFLMFFLVLSVWKIPKFDMKAKIAAIFLVYTVMSFGINLFLIKTMESAYIVTYAARLAKLGFYLLSAFVTSRIFFNTKYFSKALVACSLIFAGLLFMQYVMFYGFDKIFLPRIPSLLYIEDYAAVDYDRFFFFFFRPFSVFLEPAQYCQYIVVSICMTLFSSEYGIKKKMVISGILALSILGSTSAQGLLYLGIIVAIYIIVSIKNKKILIGLVVLGVVAVIFAYFKIEFIKEIIDRLLFNEGAREARMGTYSFIGELEGINKYIGMGYGKIPEGEYFAGLPYVWYGTGIIGYVLSLAMFGSAYYYASSKRSKVLCIVFFAAYLATSLFYNYMLFWYFTLILCVRRDDVVDGEKSYLFFRKSYLRRKELLENNKNIVVQYEEERSVSEFIDQFESNKKPSKKVLFILGMYHPHYSANGLCTKNIVDECVARGYDVKCIVNSYHNEKSRCVVDGAQLYRIEAKLFDRVDQWCQRQKIKGLAVIVKKVSLVFNKIKLIITAPVWPLCSPVYTSRFLEKAEELYKKEPFDVVVSVYTPVSSLMAGYRLKKKHPEIEFIPYFLDSLSGGYGPKYFSKAKIINRGLGIEKKVFDAADKIVIMKSAEEHQYTFNREFKDKMCVLDIPMLKQTMVCEQVRENEKIKLLYVGSLNPVVRNPQTLIDALKLIENKSINVEFVGNIECKQMFQELKNVYNDRLVFTDFLNHDELSQKIAQADVLINIGNLVSTMVPSKIFEYMSYGKPVISTCDIDDEPSAQYLAKYPLSLTINGSDSAKINALKLDEFLSESVGKRVEFDTVKNEMYLNTPEAFVNKIFGE